MVLVRIVVIDYYMSPPIPGLDVTYSEFRGSSVSQVPILRCFGSNEIGQKICVHIHGVFPYLYIPYDGVGNVDSLMYQLASSIDKAVNVSLNQANSSMQYVYKISLVSGIPMYGYHQKKHQFFKIYLYNPSLVSTISNLLINRNVLDRIFQPHEAHINFTLQFMIDYNLHGMSKMTISDIKYRGNTSEELYSVENIEKITLCELEGDINAGHILNQQDIISGKLAANPGIAALWEDEKQRLRNKNQSSQLGEFLELKNMKFTPTKSHLIFKQALLERLAISSTDNETVPADLDMSVYPAETPGSVSLQNASIVDLHTPSSLELSLDDTFCQSQSILDTTLKPENATMDEDAQKFLLLLEELAEEKENKKGLEEDSILSQTIKDADQSDESNEDILDLSMPLGSMTTPQKIVVSANANSEHTEDIEDIFNTTLIPQIDGQYDLSDNEFYQYSGVMTRSRCKKIENLKSQLPKQNPKNVCAKRSMPLLDDIFENPIELVPNFLPKTKKNSEQNIAYQKELVNIEHLDKTKGLTASPSAKIRKKRNTIDSIEKTLKLISFRVNKMYARRKLNSVIKLISKKEKLFHSSKKYVPPKFIIKPSAKRFLENFHYHRTSNTTISNIALLTQNYTAYNLHLTLKYPDDQNFLYYYGGRDTPDVIEVPSNLSEEETKFICTAYQPQHFKNIKILDDMLKRNLIFKSKILTVKSRWNKNRKDVKNIKSENISVKLENSKENLTKPDIKVLTKATEKIFFKEVAWANKNYKAHLKFLKDTEICHLEKKTFKSLDERLEILNKVNCLKDKKDIGKTIRKYNDFN